jgi:hypothetical protein
MNRRYFNSLTLIALGASIVGGVCFALGVHHWRILQNLREAKMEHFQEQWATEENFFYAALCALVALTCRVVHKVRRTRESEKRREAFRRGICISCGYDLRATPQRRPECGAVYKRYL